MCPHCGGDLVDHISSLWGKFRRLHSKKKEGFALLSPEERSVLSQKAAEIRWGKRKDDAES